MEPVIQVRDLEVSFGRSDALRGMSLEVRPGRCHALIGRNGAGKTTTLKALLGLVPLRAGQVRVFGMDLVKNEQAIKSRMAYVPDAPGFYPWMTVREALIYAASFRERWNAALVDSLLARFELDPGAPTSGLSKGQRMQLALTSAVGADPDLLILDEPTNGLDPMARRQFLEAVIGAFQDLDPEQKTLLVSTHLISEFEGVVDDFTVMDRGRAVMTLDADEARSRFHRVRAWFDRAIPDGVALEALSAPRRDGRMLEVVVDGEAEEAERRLTAAGASRVEACALSLEEILTVTATAGATP